MYLIRFYNSNQDMIRLYCTDVISLEYITSDLENKKIQFKVYHDGNYIKPSYVGFGKFEFWLNKDDKYV